jgi:hypothetical protein
MSSLHKRNGSNNNNNGGSSSFFFSEEEEESSSSPLKSPMTATAAAPSHRTSNNGSSIGGSSSVLLRSSPRSSPNNKSSSMNSKEKKNKTTSSVALLIKYLFLAILILLVYFLLRINLQLIQRERAKRVSFSLYNTQNGAVIATTVNGKQVGGKSSPLRARSSNNDAQQQEEEEGQDAEKLLHNRLVTLRSEVATMQKKVDDMKKRIGHIKDIRKSSVELRYVFSCLHCHYIFQIFFYTSIERRKCILSTLIFILPFSTHTLGKQTHIYRKYCPSPSLSLFFSKQHQEKQ